MADEKAISLDNLKTFKTKSDALYATKTEVDRKQDTLVSGTNIKTINGTSLLGSGNLAISTGSSSVDTLSSTYQSPDGQLTDTLVFEATYETADIVFTRQYGGTISYNITVPEKSGTLALTSDIPSTTSTYSATGSNPVNGVAVASAISTKQDASYSWRTYPEVIADTDTVTNGNTASF